jgi:exonuclease III
LKVVSWNLNHRGTPTWDYLCNSLRPDVALLQEALPPAAYKTASLLNTVVPEGHHKWGSAIYLPDLRWQELPLDRHKGWVIAAEASMPNDEMLVIVSVHAKWNPDGGAGRVIPNLRRIFCEDLPAILRDRHHIVGGDLNTGRLFGDLNSRYAPRNEHNDFFDYVERNGYFNCHRHFHDVEEQTIFSAATKRPYQIDYLFVSESLKDRVTSCDVLNNPETLALSDHLPVVATIDMD